MIGLLGSLVYVGLTIGSVVSSWVFDKINPKYILSIALLLNIASLIIFPLTNYFYLLVISRTLVGFF
jgi:MFS family permease